MSLSADLARPPGGVVFLTGTIRVAEVGLATGGVYGGGGSFRFETVATKINPF